MNRSRITDDMFARISALLVEGKTKAEIAAMYGVTHGSLAVLCCRRGISLRKGGSLPKRTKSPKRTKMNAARRAVTRDERRRVEVAE